MSIDNRLRPIRINSEIYNKIGVKLYDTFGNYIEENGLKEAIKYREMQQRGIELNKNGENWLEDKTEQDI